MCHRCGAKKCQRYILPHHKHPIFKTGWGQGRSSLKEQSVVLLCALAGSSITTTHLLTKKNDKMIRGIYQRLDQCRRKAVERDEKKIKCGASVEWNDVEADEVDLGKEDTGTLNTPASKPVVKWEQWGGVVERGFPNTLLLTRLHPKTTKRRAPGPGPITKTDWKPVADRYLKGRKVILHTDGAKSYRLKTSPVKGILHDWVVHKKKKVTIRGRTAWIRPKYVVLFEHQLPDGKTIRTKGGTQIIDRAWGVLRSHIGSRSGKVSSTSITARIRSAQWCYWNRGEDLWLATGQMLHSFR